MISSQTGGARSLWNAAMLALHQNLEAKNFDEFKGTTVEAPYCSDTGMLATSNCPHTATGVYKADNTPGYCTTHPESTPDPKPDPDPDPVPDPSEPGSNPSSGEGSNTAAPLPLTLRLRPPPRMLPNRKRNKPLLKYEIPPAPADAGRDFVLPDLAFYPESRRGFCASSWKPGNCRCPLAICRWAWYSVFHYGTFVHRWWTQWKDRPNGNVCCW